MAKESATSRAERAIARVADRQHGVVTTAQLEAAGIAPSGITLRVGAGRLHRIYRGVYTVGHTRLSREDRWMAAVLAAGAGAVLSHRSAAALWDMRPQSSGPVEVTVPGTAGRKRRYGLVIHRSTQLSGEVTRHRGIPVTTPSRTLADLRRMVTKDHLRAALRRAEILRLDVGRQPEYRPDRTRSELERILLRLCRRHRLPPPEVNVLVGPYEVDFLWRDRKLIVEADSYRYHGTRSSFGADRARDVQLKAWGYTVLRFTHEQLTAADSCVAATLRKFLGEDPPRLPDHARSHPQVRRRTGRG